MSLFPLFAFVSARISVTSHPPAIAKTVCVVPQEMATARRTNSRRTSLGAFANDAFAKDGPKGVASPRHVRFRDETASHTQKASVSRVSSTSFAMVTTAETCLDASGVARQSDSARLASAANASRARCVTCFDVVTCTVARIVAARTRSRVPGFGDNGSMFALFTPAACSKSSRRCVPAETAASQDGDVTTDAAASAVDLKSAP